MSAFNPIALSKTHKNLGTEIQPPSYTDGTSERISFLAMWRLHPETKEVSSMSTNRGQPLVIDGLSGETHDELAFSAALAISRIVPTEFRRKHTLTIELCPGKGWFAYMGDSSIPFHDFQGRVAGW